MEEIGRQSFDQRLLAIYDDLTRSERHLADVILENPRALANFTASELSERARISNATTARLFKRLGYNNFREARRDARDLISRETSIPSVAQSADVSGLTVDLNLHLTSDIQNLARTFAALRPDALARSVEVLAGAAKIWVVGFGDNYPLAHLARALLIRIKPDIRMIPIGGFPVPEEFASITAEDAVLAMGFRRRTARLIRIMQSAKEAGATIVMVSDATASTTTEIADITLRCRSRGASLFDSFVAPVSLMACLCASIAAKIGDEAIERLHLIESIHDSWGDDEGPVSR